LYPLSQKTSGLSCSFDRSLAVEHGFDFDHRLKVGVLEASFGVEKLEAYCCTSLEVYQKKQAVMVG
tara:strand:+ start:356 stop:553 length:198 start_codon:yes stop_codon:yes gene_type:complete